MSILCETSRSFATCFFLNNGPQHNALQNSTQTKRLFERPQFCDVFLAQPLYRANEVQYSAFKRNQMFHFA